MSGYPSYGGPEGGYGGVPVYGDSGSGGYGQSSAPGGYGGSGYGGADGAGGYGGGYMGGDSYGSRGGGYGGGEFRGGRGGGGFRGGRGGYNGGSGGGGFGEGKVQSDNQIYISGLPTDITDEGIADFFGAIGMIKLDRKTGNQRVWIYKDHQTGLPKGEATVTYDDPQAAQSAIKWFNNKDYNGHPIKVQMAMIKAPPAGGWRGGRGGPRGGGFGGGRGRDDDFGGGRGGFRGRGRDDGRQSNFNGRPGDWTCPNSDCSNTNFAWRNECNKCQTEKPGGGGEDGGHGARGGGYGGGGRDGGDFGGGYGGRGGGAMRGGRGDNRHRPY